MEDIEKLVKALRENAEWCDANEYEVPICMGDDQREAADAIKKLLALAQNGQSAIDTNQRLVDKIRELQAENERIRSNCYARDAVQAIIDERDMFKALYERAVKYMEDYE